MIKSVSFSETVEVPYKIELVKPDQNQFIIDSISGISAGKAELFTSKRASMDSDVFNGARLGARNIVMTMGYGYELDPEIGRELSYEVFPLMEPIKMTFETDLRTVEIDGYVESNESSIFTNTPGFDLSFICVEPYFKSPAEDMTTFRLYALEDKFEFPFSNESTSENLIVMGEYNVDGYGELRYEGSQRTGAIIRFMFNGLVTHPMIANDRTGQTMRIDTNILQSFTGDPIHEGDIIEINTIRGQKAVTLIRDGVPRSIINALAPSSRWIELRKGVNPISVTADAGMIHIQTEVMYDTYYSGL